MTMLKLENLVLDGVRVVDNATGLVRLASTEAGKRSPAVITSVKRHLLSSPAQPESDARPRYHAAIHGGNNAPRAGRLAVSVGVSCSRIPSTREGRVCRKAGPGPKIALPLSRLRSGRMGNGFGQPFQALAFTSQLPATRLCPAWQKHMTRMARVETTGLKPVGGR
jgi:hypothetical protein